MNCVNSLMVVTGSRIVSPLAVVQKSNIPALSRKVLSLVSCTAEVCWVRLEIGFTFAEMLYASGGKVLFRMGAVGCSGHGYGSCFTAFRVSTSGKWMVGVLLEKGFDSR